jgi:hypothetical protein
MNTRKDVLPGRKKKRMCYQFRRATLSASQRQHIYIFLRKSTRAYAISGLIVTLVIEVEQNCLTGKKMHINELELKSRA